MKRRICCLTNNYELFCCGAEFVIPFLAEAADEGFAEELIETDAALCAKANCILTDVPTMIVKPRQCPKFLLANGIEMAADGSLSQEASLRSPESAVTTADNARHQFALRVRVGNTLFVDDCLCSS